VEFSKWYECEIFDAAINLLQWCDDKVHWTINVASLWDKISWWAKFLKKLFEEKGKISTMDGRRCLKPFGPNWKLCVMDSKHNKCAPIVEWRQ